MKLLALLLLGFGVYCQPLTLDYSVQRVPLNYVEKPPITQERVTIIYYGTSIGLLSKLDTLELLLTKLKSGTYVYIDIRHDNQVYRIIRVIDRHGRYSYFFTPLKPYKRRVYSLNIRSYEATMDTTNICD